MLGNLDKGAKTGRRRSMECPDGAPATIGGVIGQRKPGAPSSHPLACQRSVTPPFACSSALRLQVWRPIRIVAAGCAQTQARACVNTAYRAEQAAEVPAGTIGSSGRSLIQARARSAGHVFETPRGPIIGRVGTDVQRAAPVGSAHGQASLQHITLTSGSMRFRFRWRTGIWSVRAAGSAAPTHRLDGPQATQYHRCVRVCLRPLRPAYARGWPAPHGRFDGIVRQRTPPPCISKEVDASHPRKAMRRTSVVMAGRVLATHHRPAGRPLPADMPRLRQRGCAGMMGEQAIEQRVPSPRPAAGCTTSPPGLSTTQQVLVS